MTVQIPAETPFYRPDGSAVLYAGVPAALGVDLSTVQEEGPPIPVNTAGRVYEQRILDGQGAILLTITGANGAAGRVTFTFTPENGTTLLPPGDVVAKDLTHQVGELTGNGFQPLLVGPLAIRRLRRGMPATVLQLQAGLDVVVVRYEGAPGPTLLETLIASGDLAEDADEADLLALLRAPVLSSGEAALTAITTARGQAVTAVQQQQTTSVNAVTTAAGAAVDQAIPAALAQQIAASAAGPAGGLFVAVQAGVGAVSAQQVTSVNAVAAREGQAITAVQQQQTTSVNAVAAQGATSIGAVTTEGNTQVARVAATPASGMYQTKAAGDAAGLATGVHFIVPGASGSGFLVYRVTGAGTSVLVNTLADMATINTALPTLDEDDELATIEAMYNRMCRQYDGLPEAAIGIGCVAQSRGSKRLTAVSGMGPPNSFMPSGGAYAVGLAYNASNALWQGLPSEFATRVQFQETGGEGPLGGFAWGVSGYFDEVSVFSAAVGARTVAVLTNDSGPYANESAAMDNLCRLSIAAGKKPCPVILPDQSEADATGGADLAVWTAATVRAWEVRQWRAAVACGRPDWIAPVIASQQMQMSNTADKDQLILEAQLAAAARVRRAVVIPTNHISHTSDRVHPDSPGMYEIGQMKAHVFIQMHFHGRLPHYPEVIAARFSGSTVTLTWNQDMTRDAAFDYGTLLNADFLDGYGLIDNGTWRRVTSATTVGRITTLGLAAPITGTAAQQVLYIGCQPTTSTLTSGSAYRSGHIIRATDQAAGNDNFNSMRQAFAHKRWARMQRFAQVQAA